MRSLGGSGAIGFGDSTVRGSSPNGCRSSVGSRVGSTVGAGVGSTVGSGVGDGSGSTGSAQLGGPDPPDEDDAREEFDSVADALGEDDDVHGVTVQMYDTSDAVVAETQIPR